MFFIEEIEHVQALLPQKSREGTMFPNIYVSIFVIFGHFGHFQTFWSVWMRLHILKKFFVCHNHCPL